MIKPAPLLTYLIWLTFIWLVVAMSWNAPAWDLTASYVSGRLVAARQTSALYDQASYDAVKQPNSAWSAAVIAGGITDKVVTPYVQTPLWGWLVSPLAAAMDFNTFKRVFAALSAAAAALMIFSAARHWAPQLATPAWQAVLLAGLFCSVPFEVAVVLGQTHVLFIYLAVCAAIAALRGKDVTAGTLLALAATVKITPAWIAVTWLAAGRWKAALSFAISISMIAALTVAATGWNAFKDYLQTLKGISETVTLALNNDSLAAILLGGWPGPNTPFQWKAVPAPTWINLLGVASITLCALAGGLLDRRSGGRPEQKIGAILTLVAATALTPRAWNHYFIVLVLPIMVFLVAGLRERKASWIALALVVMLFNVPPMAYTIVHYSFIPLTRSHFWAALLCMCALPAVSLANSDGLLRRGTRIEHGPRQAPSAQRQSHFDHAALARPEADLAAMAARHLPHDRQA